LIIERFRPRGLSEVLSSPTPATIIRASAIDAIRGRYVGEPMGCAAVEPACGQGFQQYLCPTSDGVGAASDTHERFALPVAADESAAKAVVLQLVDELGFDGVNAGSLDESWRQQPGTPVYAKDFDAGGARRALSEASRERKPEWRATSNSPRSFENPA